MLRSARGYDKDENSLANGMADDRVKNPSRTKQSFKEDCDINVIVGRFMKTGMASGPGRMPTYGDFTGVSDYHTAMNLIRQAEEGFMKLPATVRTRFSNDPQKYMEFAQDPANIDELRKMGLAKALPKVDTPDKPDVPA